MIRRQFVRGCIVALTLVGCEREARRLDDSAPSSAPAMVAQVPLEPGPQRARDTTMGPFDENAYGTAQGQALFGQMNCSGCHGNGGGNMGPALMDDKWIYGSTADQVYATIAEGRPNGMPSWKNRLTTTQIWQLVAYVRSLSGLTPKGARPTRQDHMMVKPAPAQTPRSKPKSAPPG